MADNNSETTPANWYPDPLIPGQLRYWDGSSWTDHYYANEPATAVANHDGGATSDIRDESEDRPSNRRPSWMLITVGVVVAVLIATTAGIVLTRSTSTQSPARTIQGAGVTFCPYVQSLSDSLTALDNLQKPDPTSVQGVLDFYTTQGQILTSMASDLSNIATAAPDATISEPLNLAEGATYQAGQTLSKIGASTTSVGQLGSTKAAASEAFNTWSAAFGASVAPLAPRLSATCGVVVHQPKAGQ